MVLSENIIWSLIGEDGIKSSVSYGPPGSLTFHWQYKQRSQCLCSFEEMLAGTRDAAWFYFTWFTDTKPWFDP